MHDTKSPSPMVRLTSGEGELHIRASLIASLKDCGRDPGQGCFRTLVTFVHGKKCETFQANESAETIRQRMSGIP